ncbi:MAG: CHAD domain-containing protein [Candidatus Aureabacteria bacterium]|nr:CHAD domain-containing protein [Candidatus Auribacterota bacterium]
MNTEIRTYAARIISRPFKRFLEHVRDAKTGKDIEDLHRIRVASRRLRSALWALKEAFPEKSLKKWKKGLQNVSRTSGDARDIDVKIDFLKKLKNSQSSAPYRYGLNQMIILLQVKRNGFQTEITSSLDDLLKKNILKEIKNFIKKSPTCTLSEIKTPALYSLAEKRISRRLAELKKQSVCAAQPDRSTELHLLRIAAKKLRYTLECFETLYGQKLKRFTDECHSIQNMLGAMHDFDVWIQSAPHFFNPEEKRILAAVDFFLKKCRTLRNQNYNDFLSLWKRLEKEDFFHVLSQAIAVSARIRKKIVQQAVGLARSIHFEEEHTRVVTKLSLRLFDELECLHHLGEKDNLLLEIACLLHDIGRTDGGENHNKIARDRILDSSQLQLPEKDKVIIALIARYHRDALPKNSHRWYSALGKEDRITVKKLSSLIRIADGLDRTHQSLVTNIQCDVSKQHVVLRISAKGFSAIDKTFGKVKADLFEKTFQKDVIIDWAER